MPKLMSGTHVQLATVMHVFGRRHGRMAELDGDRRLDFSRKLLVEILAHALRVEGHAFLPEQFQCWVAGLDTLTNEGNRARRSARSLVRAILVSLQHEPDPWLQQAAAEFLEIFEGVNDGHPSAENAGKQVEFAAELAEESVVEAKGSPVDAIAIMARKAAAETVFSPKERGVYQHTDQGRTYVYQVDREPSPYWALDIAASRLFAAAIQGWCPLPLPGLFNHELLQGFKWPEEELDCIIRGLMKSGSTIDACIAVSTDAASLAGVAGTGLRGHASLPQLARLLLVYGQLRVRHAALLLGKTEIGVTKIIEQGRKAGLLMSTRVKGVRMIRLGPGAKIPVAVIQSPSPRLFEISQKVEDELAEAESAIDRISARFGSVSPSGGDEDDEDEVPGWV